MEVIIFPLVAVKQSLIANIRAKWSSYSDRRKEAIIRLRDGIEEHKRVTVGGKVYITFSMAEEKAWIDYINAKLPRNAFIILGAWEKGERGEPYCRQVGTDWVFDVNGGHVLDGNGMPAVTGTPTYPLHARIKDVAPDVNDINGVKPRPATNQEALNIMNVVYGQAVRMA